tara:strand:- start:2134 stop:2337 length:204 start_codon:yes stop_codon:yes gene_type:complete
MLKFLFFGIGFVLLFEGLIYFFLANKIKYILQELDSLGAKKIKSFSTLLIFLGFCLIYFTFRFYSFS